MRLLVTGGAGFIGANFVRGTLRERPDVSVTVLDAFTYAGSHESLAGLDGAIRVVEGDVTDARVVSGLVADCDVVAHFAAETHVDNALADPAPFLHSNVLGTFAVLEAVRRYGVRLHHVSTDEVYGELTLDDPHRFTADTPYNPSSPYSSTKAAADMLVRAWVRSYGVAATISNTPVTTAHEVITYSSTRAVMPGQKNVTMPAAGYRAYLPQGSLTPREAGHGLGQFED